jgi:hypothetical protein
LAAILGDSGGDALDVVGPADGAHFSLPLPVASLLRVVMRLTQLPMTPSLPEQGSLRRHSAAADEAERTAKTAITIGALLFMA